MIKVNVQARTKRSVQAQCSAPKLMPESCVEQRTKCSVQKQPSRAKLSPTSNSQPTRNGQHTSINNDESFQPPLNHQSAPANKNNSDSKINTSSGPSETDDQSQQLDMALELWFQDVKHSLLQILDSFRN